MDDLNPRHDAPIAPPSHREPVRATVEPVRHTLRTWLIFLLIVALLIGGFAYWRSHTTETAARPGRGGLPPPPVVAATAIKGDVKITDAELGTVVPMATVSVVTQIAGQLMDMGFKEGQDVKKGDFLAQIDPRPYQAALDQAQGQLLKDQAALKQAQIDLVRYQTLARQDSIAKQQADDQEWLVHQDEGQVKVDEALVENAKLNLVYCHIVSPVTGRIGLRGIDPGNYVTVANATALAVVTQLQPITVVFVLPEDELPAVLKRLHAGATLTVSATDRSGTIPLGEGTLYAVDSQIDTTTGTVKLKAEFPNKDETLFPNQFVNVSLLVDTLKDTIIVPTAAIQRGAPGTFVYLIKDDDTVTVRKVKLGPVDGENVAILDGLDAGDRVVIDGADKLREGAKVKIGTPPSAGAGAGKMPIGATPPTGQALPQSAPSQGSQSTSQPDQSPPSDTSGQQHRHRQKPGDDQPGGGRAAGSQSNAGQ